MTTLVIDHRNVSLDYEADCLLVRQPDQALRSLPLARLQRILCMHGVTVSTRLIGHCQRLGIDFIVINSRHGELSFAVHANHLRQARRRIRQYRLTSRPDEALPLAKRLILQKLTVARRTLRQQAADPQRDAVIQTIECQARQIACCSDAAQLLGHEGCAQRSLFDYWRQRLPSALGFVRRQRRPPPDPVNALLFLSFTLLYQESIRQCLVHGLDPWLGIYHQEAAGRLSLACDLMEPLRPLIESWVVSLFLDNELDRRHFSRQEHACLLGKAGRELYYALWHAQLPAWSRRLANYAALLAKYLDA